MLSDVRPNGSGERGEVDLPITQDALQRIYANEEDVGHAAHKICVLQVQPAGFASGLKQEKKKFTARTQRPEAQDRQISHFLDGIIRARTPSRDCNGDENSREPPGGNGFGLCRSKSGSCCRKRRSQLRMQIWCSLPKGAGGHRFAGLRAGICRQWHRSKRDHVRVTHQHLGRKSGKRAGLALG
jgi:hypothetical protein